MFYYSPGPLLRVVPLSAFPTPVPPTAYYYTVPAYYLPQTAPALPIEYGVPYGVPVEYGTPVMYEPAYVPMAPVSPPRGEYRLGRCLMICQ